MPTVTRRETFSPVLLSSESLALSQEQRDRVREILEIGASDSKFASKMWDAIYYVLTAGSAVPPVVSSLSPDTAALGTPSFDLHVLGIGFTPTSVIIWNGSEEPTTFVSATEVTTGVDMSTAEVAITIPVSVLNPDGVLSDPVMFTLTPSVPETLSTPAPEKKEEKKKEPLVYPAGKKLAVEEHSEKGK